jgi:hypothetical protein
VDKSPDPVVTAEPNGTKRDASESGASLDSAARASDRAGTAEGLPPPKLDRPATMTEAELIAAKGGLLDLPVEDDYPRSAWDPEHDPGGGPVESAPLPLPSDFRAKLAKAGLDAQLQLSWQVPTARRRAMEQDRQKRDRPR